MGMFTRSKWREAAPRNPDASRELTLEQLNAAISAAWQSGGKPTRAMWVQDGVFYDVDISK